MDEYVLTTHERFFELRQDFHGTVILNLISTPCTIDTIIYNSTTVVKLTSGDTITVYSPCNMTEFKKGDEVTITHIDYNKELFWSKRDIFARFPKRSDHYPYYQCKSCKYDNTIGKITLANNGEHP
jgi:hypothetical protein